MSVPAIEGIGLTLRFGGFTALNDVDIKVPPGEIRGLIGPNGAGKSTLMNVLSGRCATAVGSVRLFGREISKLPARHLRTHGLARSFQKTYIFGDLGVEQQVRLAARSATVDNTEEVLEALGLTSLSHQRAAEISYGDQRRLDLALALVGRPKVLLLDEPAAGLSLADSLALSNLLRDLAQRWQVTVLIVEHDMEVIFSICDRITVLQLGQILTEGNAEEIRTNTDVIRAYLGSAA